MTIQKKILMKIYSYPKVFLGYWFQDFQGCQASSVDPQVFKGNG